MELGFQLSYAAILGIIVCFPVFRTLFRIKNPILRWLWNAASVSFAAQLLAAPLVIYHFHYLPVYSIFSSILAIPVLSLLIALFTASVPFIISGFLDHVFFEILGRLAWLMNFTMETVSAFPGATIKDLHLSLPVLCLWMLVLGLGMCFLLSRLRAPAYLMVFVCSITVLYSAWSLAKRSQTSELVLCHFRGGSQVILREGREVDIYSWGRDSLSQVYMHRYRSEVWSQRIYQVNYNEAVPGHGIRGSISDCRELSRGIWAVGNDNLLFWVLRGPVVDSRALGRMLDYTGPGNFEPRFILLSGEPGSFRSRSPGDGASVELIMDGSNRSWFRERMHEFSAGIYDTERQGAYVKRW
jgi:hypothetical protein